MKLDKKQTIQILLIGFAITACKDRFEPKILQTDINLLVVDGYLNNGPEETRIRLSRTSRLEEGTAGRGELNAQLYIEAENGAILYYFDDAGQGDYTLPRMDLDLSKKYRLKINTADGKLYSSDLITLKQTPAIDSINWKRQQDGIGIFVNTHDAAANTKYYRWDYTETWEYRSYNFSYLIWENTAIRNREPNEFVYYCWQTSTSANMMLGSSAKLSQDIIYEYPVKQIPMNSIQLSVKYSIMVRQYALTKECFEYLENLKKITEQMGSIFDAQPSQITGNIHCVSNPDEPVLGFATGGSKSEQRIFISNGDVLPWNYSRACGPTIVVPTDIDSLKFYFDGAYTPIDEAFPPGAGYNAGVTSCVDCLAGGGTNIKPGFWP